MAAAPGSAHPTGLVACPGDELPDVAVERRGEVVAATFQAMASPCEVLVDHADLALARDVGVVVAAEARRIERKFSRYRPDGAVARINGAAGQELLLDEETAMLMDFAARCHRLSDGRFDVTSGVLRRCWRFDGSDRVPAPEAVAAALRYVGFERLEWRRPRLRMPFGMEIDFGGIGKEYAVDRALALAAPRAGVAVLVNFGGDLAASGRPRSGAWTVGVERPDTDREAALVLDLEQGGLATSGDTRRFLRKNGVRYGHILDVRTGWPVPGAPRSVTVAAGTCTEAGMLATFAMLAGRDAERFLAEEGVRYWCLR